MGRFPTPQYRLKRPPNLPSRAYLTGYQLHVIQGECIGSDDKLYCIRSDINDDAPYRFTSNNAQIPK